MKIEKKSYWHKAISLNLTIILILIIASSCTFGSKNEPTAKDAFVTRSASSLLLNGQPFRFAGANIHWLALDDETNYPSQFRVNDALDVAKEMGLTAIRSLDLGISTGCSNCIEPSSGIFNEKALEHDDYVIKAAADRGLRLIIPLTDNYHYPFGGKHNFTDWRGLSDENQFYTQQQIISDFETYVRTLLNHVNIYTGISYKDDPTILAWETGNELQPPTSWTQTISTYIKSIDKSHLIIDGRYGIDPNAAQLRAVDILSDHYYPKSISRMNTDVQAATKAGKAFVVGEFDWNDANGGDPLNSFLSNIQSNSAIAGDAFWELWSHDDQYGYKSSVAQYTLHYPGQPGTERNSAELLRSYAYKMRNQTVPPDSIPRAPLLETVVKEKAGNTLVWQGAANAADYTIQRATAGPNGPWSVICNRCATDYDTPWTDILYVPPGNLWYRIIPYNISDVAGPPSQAYQAGSTDEIIDDLNDWSHVYQHSDNLVLDSTYSQFMRGDTSHALRTTATPEFVTWKQANMISFQAITYFWPKEPVSAFSIYTSADGSNWKAAAPQIISVNGNWPQYIYTLRELSDVNYVKMEWNNLKGQAWSPTLGSVSILYRAG